ncbi:hypothetical protein C9374_007760 [Naegleria lovaniensis]|uniref:Uncharacterized protein n=1 Tax=Naegleria lovaniensis TaxID=51637 RepID=A0AA88KGD8_NAELO|nr:uncharacterized protein C9374_007760 [Naegleria lovaniensis]KAG2379122.1 hypothetical protein C9374_007760 [Naegleria lovaniensis]
MTNSFSSLLRNEKSFRNSLLTQYCFVPFEKTGDSSGPSVWKETDLESVSGVFSDPNGPIQVIFSFLSMKELWWKIRFVCKCWFKYCLYSRTKMDFDGLSLENFLMSDPKVNAGNLLHAFNDLMCHLCWSEQLSAGRVDRMSNFQSLNITLYQSEKSYDLSVAMTGEHLEELTALHGNTLKELSLNGRSMISKENLKQALTNLPMLESLTIIDSYAMDHELLYYLLPNVKHLTVKRCPFFFRETTRTTRELKETKLNHLKHVCCEEQYTEAIVNSSVNDCNDFVVHWVRNTNIHHSKEPHARVSIGTLVLNPSLFFSEDLEVDAQLVQLNVKHMGDWREALYFACSYVTSKPQANIQISSNCEIVLKRCLEVMKWKEIIDIATDEERTAMKRTRKQYRQLLRSMFEPTNATEMSKDSYKCSYEKIFNFLISNQLIPKGSVFNNEYRSKEPVSIHDVCQEYRVYFLESLKKRKHEVFKEIGAEMMIGSTEVIRSWYYKLNQEPSIKLRKLDILEEKDERKDFVNDEKDENSHLALNSHPPKVQELEESDEHSAMVDNDLEFECNITEI